VGTAAALALSLSGAVETVVHPIEAVVGGVIMPAAGLVFGVAFAAAFLRPATAALPAFVIAFALANRIAAPGAPANYAVTDPCKTRPDIYEAIVDASTWLDWTHYDIAIPSSGFERVVELVHREGVVRDR